MNALRARVLVDPTRLSYWITPEVLSTRQCFGCAGRAVRKTSGNKVHSTSTRLQKCQASLTGSHNQREQLWTPISRAAWRYVEHGEASRAGSLWLDTE